jgi:hypothetical protein
VETIPDRPVQQHQAGMHGLVDVRPASVDQYTQIVQQRRRVRRACKQQPSLTRLNT